MNAGSWLFPSDTLEPNEKPLDQPWWVTPSYSLLPPGLARVLDDLLPSTDSEDGSEDHGSSSSGDGRLELIPPEYMPSNISPMAVRELLRPQPVGPVLGLPDAAPGLLPSSRGPARGQHKGRNFNFAIVFHGYDLENHADFELVPRLIGRRGCNMAPIYKTGAGARVRGRGSGYKEVKTSNGDFEKDETLQLAVNCRSMPGGKWYWTTTLTNQKPLFGRFLI